MNSLSQGNTVRVRTRSKINLFLDVLDRRPDGYHEIRSVMQSLELGDDLIISCLDGTGQSSSSVDLAVTGYSAPTDRSNLVVRAAELVLQACGISVALRIHLHKRVPAASGLGGGSSDAAGTIVGLNALLDLGLSHQEMEELGSRLGADVPFCIRCGTARAEGIGERLTRLPAPSSLWAVLVIPHIQVSTAEVYSLFDARSARDVISSDIRAIERALGEDDLSSMAAAMDNALYPVVSVLHPVVEQVVGFLLSEGALGAMMSGSGPCVFGIVKSESEARCLAQSASSAFGECFVTYTRASSGMLLKRE